MHEARARICCSVMADANLVAAIDSSTVLALTTILLDSECTTMLNASSDATD